MVSKSGHILTIDKANKDVIAGKIWEYILADGLPMTI